MNKADLEAYAKDLAIVVKVANPTQLSLASLRIRAFTPNEAAYVTAVAILDMDPGIRDAFTAWLGKYIV